MVLPPSVARQLELLAPFLDARERTEVATRLARHQDAWPALIAEARQAQTDGEPATGERAQRLALRWLELFAASYYGEDSLLEAKIRRAFAAEPGLSDRPELDESLLGYMHDAMQHHFSPYRGLQTAQAPKPSAFMVALHRAAHQLLDVPVVFDDPVALAILGDAEAESLRVALDSYRNPFSLGLRASLAVRSRLAEDVRAAAALRGVHQYVILGAGLDTFAYRGSLHPDCRIFEVDLPQTQEWKRRQLADCGIAEPAQVRYVPVCFEQEALADALERGGFDRRAPAVFSWLGVTCYLEPQAVFRTLDMIGGCAAGTELVFDYHLAPDCVGPLERRILQGVAGQLAARGEALRSDFAPQALAQRMREAGFAELNDFDAAALGQRYLRDRADGMSLAGISRIMHARV
jgi:methyltransferase (TIGR00027 family)